MATSSSYEIEILSTDNSLEEWDRFVDDSPQGCIFCRSWWLKAVCPNGFEILTLRKGGRLMAGMPIYRKRGYNIIVMPKLTPSLGVLLRPSTADSYERKLSYEMDILDALVEAIPKFRFFSMSFHCNFTNWLPFYWAGYIQATNYTYVIPDITDLERVVSGFAHSKRKNIKKAEKVVSVHTDLSPDEFYANHALTLSKQDREISYSFDLFKRIYDVAHENECAKTWYAMDDEQNIHAAIFVVFDSKSAYYLISTIDPDFRSSGASTLLVRDAIAYVSRYTNRFDFEGSMIRGVENSFRKFGATQIQYFSISKGDLLIRCLIAGRDKMLSGIRILKGFRR